MEHISIALIYIAFCVVIATAVIYLNSGFPLLLLLFITPTSKNASVEVLEKVLKGKEKT